MVTLFLRQGENGKQVLLSFPATTPAEKADVAATMESLKSMSKTVTIQGAASEVMNLGLYLSGVDLAAEGELERINQLADRLEHMSEVDCDKFTGMLDANSISGTKDILQLTGRLTITSFCRDAAVHILLGGIWLAAARSLSRKS